MSSPAAIGTCLDWALAYYHPAGSLDPISFEQHPFGLQLFDEWDSHRAMVIRGPNQVMKSEWAGAGALYEADARGHSVIYYFPTDNAIAKHVQERVNTVVNASQHLRSRVVDKIAGEPKKVARVHMKQVGSGWVHYRGAKSPHARQATRADVVILDEYSLMDRAWLPEIMKRLNASDYKRVRYLSVPTFVGDLIDEAYEASDQRVWVVKCGRCGNRQDLDWFRDVVVQEGQNLYALRDRTWEAGSGEPSVLCRKCARPIDRLGAGRWVARHPDRDVAGFQLTRLFTHTASTADLWRVFDAAVRSGDPDSIESFYRGDLGLSYTSESAGATDTALNACRRRFLMPESITNKDAVCVAGFDVQKPYLVARVSEIVRIEGTRYRRAVFIGRLGWQDLGALFSRYPIRLAVMDSAPETTLAEEMQGKFRQLWLADYPEKKDWTDRIEPVTGKRFVRCDRTRTLDRSHSELLLQQNLLPRNAHTLPDYYKEMKAAVRVTEEDKYGNKRAAWRKTSDADDSRHADNYDWVAAELLDMGLASTPTAVSSGGSKREAAMARVRPSRDNRELEMRRRLGEKVDG